MKISFKRIGAHLFPSPAHARPGDAGLDLQTTEALFIPRNTLVIARTGWAVAIPDGYCGLVTPRSGLAKRYGLTIVNAPGVIDSGYRGEIQVLLMANEDCTFAAGDRIAQLLVIPVESVEAVQTATLPETERGEGGFGSTG